MGVRTRQDASSEVDDLEDGLLGGLAFDDAEPEPAPPSHPALRRALAWLVTLAVLAAGGLGGWAWWQARDVRAVVASSAEVYADALGALGAAQDPAAVAAAAADLPRAASRIEGERGRLRTEEGARRQAVVAQLEAERDVLLALAPLAGLADAPLRVWGGVHERLVEAVAAETRTRAGLRRHDSGGASRLPDTSVALRAIATTVGTALVADVQRSAGEVLDQLEAATRTADLRALGTDAAAQREAVEAAQSGLPGSPDATVLTSFAAALDALRGLEPVTPADTSAWPGVRSRVAEHLRVVGDADDSLAAGSVRARLPVVLASVDRLVAAAARAYEQWQPLHDAAVARQAADRTALERYAEQVRGRAADVVAVRTGLRDVVATGADTATAAAGLAPLAASAAELAAALGGTAPPEGTAAAHAELLDVVTTLQATTSTVLDELREAACQDCPVTGTPAAQALERGAERADGWDAALAGWEQAVAAALAAVDARELPAPPDA